MPIPDPLRDRSYACGDLLQFCDECDWAQRGHRCELSECPNCGEALPSMLAIEFGGTAVVRRVGGFEIIGNNGQRTLLENADLPEILQFMCRHAEDIRSASYNPPARVVRVDKTREIEGMLDLMRRGRVEAR